MAEADQRDFFISYNSHDRNWAEWIAWHLEEAGYSTRIQAWDFRPGNDFVQEMQKAATLCRSTIAVLSPHYLFADFPAGEWNAAYSDDPIGEHRKLIPVQIAKCQLEGLHRPRILIDLVGMNEAVAMGALLDGVKEGRVKPETAPAFPGVAASPAVPSSKKPVFPPSGTDSVVASVPTASFYERFEPNPFFTGRDEIIQKLHDALASGNRVGLRQAIRGMGGIGKTQTAIEYAFRYRSEYQYVFWSMADTHDALLSGFVAIARELNFPEKDDTNPMVAVEAVKKWLSTHTGWLLLLDNADDIPLVRLYLPAAKHGHVLLTSRANAFGKVAQSVEIDKLSPEDGATFLLRRINLLADDADLRTANETDRVAALAFSEEVDGLPLALDQAGAYIEEMPSSPAEYLALYRSRGAELRKRRGDMADSDHPSVSVTFSLAFQKVADANPAAADLLRLCAFLAPDAIPEEIFREGASEFSDIPGASLAYEVALAAAIQSAYRYSLLDRDTDNRSLSIHRVVQEVIRDGMTDTEPREWAERAVGAVNKAFPNPEFSNWSICERILPHALVCCRWIEAKEIGIVEAARLLNESGLYLERRGQFTGAEPLYVRSLAILEKSLGPEHPLTATSLNNLAMLYDSQDRYAEAEQLYVRSLAIREKALGPDHFFVAMSLNNLAALYKNQDRFGEAESLYLRSLVIKEKGLESDHPSVAVSLNNLAMLYDSQGRYAKTEQLYVRSLAIREKALGPEHPDTATSLNNLAEHYRSQGRYGEAEPLYLRSLAIMEKSLGPEHPNMMTVTRNYAVLLDQMWRNQEANAQRAKLTKKKTGT